MMMVVVAVVMVVVVNKMIVSIRPHRGCVSSSSWNWLLVTRVSEAKFKLTFECCVQFCETFV